MIKFQLSVRRKILIVVVTLSLVILAFGASLSFTTLRSASSTGIRYLDSHFERFRAMLEQSGAGDLAAAMLLASDPELGRALAGESAAPPPPPADAKDPKNGKDAKPAPPAPPAQSSLDAPVERLLRAVDLSLDPDLVCIFDAAGEPLSGKGLTQLSAPTIKGSRLLQDIRTGAVQSKYAIIDGVPYLVSGAPVLGAANRPSVGAVLVGRKLGTYFEQFAPRSGAAQPDKQQRV